MSKSFAAAAALAALALNCAVDVTEIEKTPRVPMTEPRYVLANVAAAFNDPDRAILERALNYNFVFHFHPDEVGEELTTGYVIPASWDRAEFLRAAGKLLESVKSTSLKVPWNKIGAPERGAGEYEAEAVLIFVVVDGTRSYRAEGSGVFGFVKSSGVKWELAAWRDKTCKLGRPGEPSLGRILALYYD